jgi:glutaredoxin
MSTMQPKQRLLTILSVVLIVGLMGAVIGRGLTSSNDSSAKPNMAEINHFSEKESVDDSVFILFYGITCPHCKEVDDWLEQTGAQEYLEIERKEVYENKANADELVRVAASCGIETRNLGVPLLYAEDQCYSGKLEIIEYLQRQLDLVQQPTQSPEVEMTENSETEL